MIRVSVNNLVSFFIVILVILNGVDYLTTTYAIEKGIGYELNPYSRELIAKGKFDDYKLYTGVLLALVGTLVIGVERSELPFKSIGTFILWSILMLLAGFVVLVYVVTVANNLIVALMNM